MDHWNDENNPSSSLSLPPPPLSPRLLMQYSSEPRYSARLEDRAIQTIDEFFLSDP